jgi:hypothetical protein
MNEIITLARPYRPYPSRADRPARPVRPGSGRADIVIPSGGSWHSTELGPGAAAEPAGRERAELPRVSRPALLGNMVRPRPGSAGMDAEECSVECSGVSLLCIFRPLSPGGPFTPVRPGAGRVLADRQREEDAIHAMFPDH